MLNDKDYAIIIGLENYQELRKLSGPKSDATCFNQWLTDIGQLPRDSDPSKPQHVIEIYSNPDGSMPNQDKIDEALKAIIDNGKVTGYRRLYFFFAGHGLGVSWKDNALCLPGWTSSFINRALSSSEYLDVVVNSGLFPEVFFFLDCCRNRMLGVRGLPPTLGWPRPGAGTQNCQSLVAYATKFDNAASENGKWIDGELIVNGYFSRALLMGLKGGAVNQKGDITINSLKSFLKSKVSELAKQDNIDQSVGYQDAFNSDIVIVPGIGSKLINVTINFKVAGELVLDGPDLAEVKRATNPSSWTLQLSKGNYNIRNLTTGDSRFFRIDGTENNFSYDFS